MRADLLVDALEAHHGVLPIQALHGVASRPHAKIDNQLALVRQGHEMPGKRLDLALRKQQAVVLVAQHIRDPGNAAGDDRRTARECFEQRVGQPVDVAVGSMD